MITDLPAEAGCDPAQALWCVGQIAGRHEFAAQSRRNRLQRRPVIEPMPAMRVTAVHVIMLSAGSSKHSHGRRFAEIPWWNLS
jgi:hypothetical protein